MLDGSGDSLASKHAEIPEADAGSREYRAIQDSMAFEVTEMSLHLENLFDIFTAV